MLESTKASIAKGTACCIKSTTDYLAVSTIVRSAVYRRRADRHNAALCSSTARPSPQRENGTSSRDLLPIDPWSNSGEAHDRVDYPNRRATERPGEGFHVEENRGEDGIFHAGRGFRRVAQAQPSKAPDGGGAK